MRKSTSSQFVLLTALVTTAAAAQWSTPDQVEKSVNRAAKLAADTYKKGGMSGLAAKSQECFKLLAKRGLDCVAIDIASRYIDRLATVQMNFPPTEYFGDEPFGARAGPAFLQVGMDMDQANQSLRALTPMLNQAVAQQLATKAPR